MYQEAHCSTNTGNANTAVLPAFFEALPGAAAGEAAAACVGAWAGAAEGVVAP